MKKTVATKSEDNAAKSTGADAVENPQEVPCYITVKHEDGAVAANNNNKSKGKNTGPSNKGLLSSLKRRIIVAKEVKEATVAAKELYKLLKEDDDDDTGKKEIIVSEVYEQDIPLVVYRSMKKFDSDEPVHYWGINIFQLLSGSESTSCDRYHELLGAGVLDVCLHSMDKFSRMTTRTTRTNISANSRLLSPACVLLGNLMDDEFLTRDVINRGGLKSIVAVMKDHRQCPKLQEEGCFALSRVVGKAPDEFVLEGGIEALVDAMNHHQRNKYVQDVSRDSLHRLAAAGPPTNGDHDDNDNRRYRNHIIQAKGLEALASIVRNFHDDEDLKKVVLNTFMFIGK